jgi:hypothetical protein
VFDFFVFEHFCPKSPTCVTTLLPGIDNLIIWLLTIYDSEIILMSCCVFPQIRDFPFIMDELSSLNPTKPIK